MDLLRLWFGLDVPVSRRAYALSGFGLMGFKYAAEALLVHALTGRWLTPLDYLNPLLSARQHALGGHDGLLWPMAVWTLPFLWIGVSMTLRRAEDAGLPAFVALLYFTPLVNYLTMLGLCLLPTRPPAQRTAWKMDGLLVGDVVRSALLGVALAVAVALAMVSASVLVFGEYGTTLFVATPFMMGVTTGWVFNAGRARSWGATIMVASIAVTMAGGALLLFALEGLFCLAMAAPIGVVMAVMGSVVGRTLALRSPLRAGGLAAIVFPLPLLSGLDAGPPLAPREVLTIAEVAAPPDVVWRNVVSFSELPDPPAWVFRMGVAYPMRATIVGQGPGALRRCEFSTGAFVEPITAWEEPTRLAFDVLAQPPPMHEWSPYRDVVAPHLDGYLGVRRGEFRLIPLPGGRTRLEGRTFYDLRIRPAAYWTLWSDAVIHAIHERVLTHIRRLSEA